MDIPDPIRQQALVFLLHAARGIAFRAGQRIAVAGFEGAAVEINLRYTVLQNPGALHLVPNQLLFIHPVRVDVVQ